MGRMTRRRMLEIILMALGIVLVAVGFLTQACSPNNPVPPATTAPATCTSPAIPLALVYWLPGVIFLVVGAVSYRRVNEGGLTEMKFPGP